MREDLVQATASDAKPSSFDQRSCTCHPDDNPPSPCPRKFSLTECRSAELERLRVENIQLKFACGYPMPANLERYILPSNPFRCGVCDAHGRSGDRTDEKSAKDSA